MDRENQSGFTLIEMMTVLAMIAVGMAVFYSVFILNWQAFDHHITRSNLWQEMDFIVDNLTLKGRLSRQINVSANSSAQTVTFMDAAGLPMAVYSMQNTGQFSISKGGNVETVSQHLDFTNSSFAGRGRGLVITLALQDDVMGQAINIATSTEVYPRNY